MSERDGYDAWVASQAGQRVPEGFCGRVMERVRTDPGAEPGDERAWWDRTWVLAGAWTAASVLLVVRVAGVVGVFVPS